LGQKHVFQWSTDVPRWHLLRCLGSVNVSWMF
jgi:hypothetical protein